jgi:cytoskeleton protein RodZ
LPESTHALMPATGASATRRWPLFVAIFLVLAAAVVWLVLPNEFWARKPAHPPSASQAAPGDTAAPVVIHPAPDAPAPSAADSAPAATGAGEAVVAPVAQIAADATNAQAADGEKTDAADATPQRKPGEKLLHFSFADNSWVEVRDRAGQLLLSKEFPAGSVRDLYGLPPLTVSIGNASEVTLAFEGKPVKLSPSQPSGVARVRLE